MKRPKLCLEEKPVYGRGHIDEGNWFAASVQSGGKSTGLLEMPLACLPNALQRRAKKGETIYFRLLIAEDGERRLVGPSTDKAE